MVTQTDGDYPKAQQMTDFYCICFSLMFMKCSIEGYLPSGVTHASNRNAQRLRQEHHELVVSLDYVVRLFPFSILQRPLTTTPKKEGKARGMYNISE